MQEIASLIEAVATLTISNRLPEARDLLSTLNRDEIFTERKKLLSRTWPKNQRRTSHPLIKVRRKDPAGSLALRIFRRDHFTCRYAHCQRRTIYIPVLKQLSRLFPDQLSYHPNWKPVDDHLLYWVYGTSIEHRLSFPHGGDSAQPNLITACYCCNDAKNYLHLDDLGWQITEPVESKWDGLESLLPALKQVRNENASAVIVERAVPTPTQRPLRRSEASIPLESIRVGSPIRACLPGKKTVRNYRVDALSLGDSSEVHSRLITLREMWKRSSDGVWVASKHTQLFKLGSLSRLSEVASIAPRLESAG